MPMPESKPMSHDRFVGLQIGRGLAALSIAYFHSWVAVLRFPEGTAHPLPVLTYYGWIAVDVFFAISGFVICFVVSGSRFTVRTFLIKRFFRLYPLWLLMLSTFAATAMIWRGTQPTETLGYFLYSATLLPTKEFPFYNVGWSLQHEMVFYLTAALLIPALGVSGLAAFLALSTLAFHMFELPWYLAQLASYHAEFLAGVLAFMARPKLKVLGPLVPLFIGATALVYFVTFFGGRPFFPIALFFLMVGFANVVLDENSAWVRPFVALGDASYSIYLIHSIVFLFASAAVSRTLPHLPLWSQEPIRIACFAVIVAASVLSWKFFESPMISLGNRLSARKAPAQTSAEHMDEYDRRASQAAGQ
jgi:exopolysaccharide production protein ExoZ